MTQTVRRWGGRLAASLAALAVSGAPAAPPDATSELVTLSLGQADIDVLRTARVAWQNCEAGAPAIEPAGSRSGAALARANIEALLPVFFLHARFQPGRYDVGAGQVLEVTPDHLKLLKATSWQGTAIDCKRPYGDFSNFTIDMAKALGLPITAGPDQIARISPQDDDRMGALHLQMQQVVTAYLRHASLAPGAYPVPRGGLNPTGAARPRLVPPTQAEVDQFLIDIGAARQATESWRVFSAIAGFYIGP